MSVMLSILPVALKQIKLLPSRSRSLISRSQRQLVTVTGSKVKRLGRTPSSLCPAATALVTKFKQIPSIKMSKVYPLVTHGIILSEAEAHLKLIALKS